MDTMPNVLLFVADGLQGRCVRDDAVVCPNMKRLAAGGVDVRGAYTPLPTCSPARASLMTGLLPHNHGVLQVEHGVDQDQAVLREHCPHWAQHLQQAGVTTALFGKWHVERSGRLNEFGWTESANLGAQAHAAASQQGVAAAAEIPIDASLSRHHTGPRGYNDQVHYGVTDVPPSERGVSGPADHATEFLQRQLSLPAGERRPWCCVASYYEPNEAMIVGREAYGLYAEAVRRRTLPLPANLHDDLLDKPNMYRREAGIFSGLSDDEWRQARACYYGRITEVDHELGRLLAVLEEAGELAETIVIVTADHGKYVGAHGLEGAHNCNLKFTGLTQNLGQH
jgi:arylsulfatase A-like enzyme